jgi:hypothetical protein
VGTVAAHLKALSASGEAQVYASLMEYAIGALPVKRKDEMEKLLKRKKPGGR